MRDRRSPQPRGRSRPDGQRSEKHRATVDSNTSEEQCHPRKIFIGGLAHKTTTQHLRDHFQRFGSIVDAVVLRWPDGRSRGFGYVTFADSDAAASVLQEQHALSGREVDVKRAVPGTNKLFVGGLPQNTAANELREHFEQFGVVSDAVVMIDPATSRSRGFGFVCFLPGQEGANAVTASLLQYQNHRIRGKWIEVKSAAPPHKLAAKNGSQDGQGTQNAAPSYEELCLSGAIQGSERPSPSPSPSVENRERHQRKGDVHKLGSPRKVALPSSPDMSHPLQSPPPGLTAPVNFDGSNADASNQFPWWSSQPFGQPFPTGGYAPYPPFGGFSPNPFEGSAIPSLGNTDYFAKPDQSGLSAAESFQRNLEQFLRQSVQDKVEKGTRDPSVSTACSSATQV